MSAKRQTINQSTTRTKEAERPKASLATKRTRLGPSLVGLAFVSLFSATSALAQSPGTVLGDVATGVGYQPATPAAADFVERARPDVDRLDYKPLTAADRANHRKNGKDIDSIVNSLEGAKAGNNQRAARVTTIDQPEGAAPAQKKKSKRPFAPR
jgi:hypothetical protein